jgi:hypothetical protein
MAHLKGVEGMRDTSGGVAGVSGVNFVAAICGKGCGDYDGGTAAMSVTADPCHAARRIWRTSCSVTMRGLA